LVPSSTVDAAFDLEEGVQTAAEILTALEAQA